MKSLTSYMSLAVFLLSSLVVNPSLLAQSTDDAETLKELEALETLVAENIDTEVDNNDVDQTEDVSTPTKEEDLTLSKTQKTLGNQGLRFEMGFSLLGLGLQNSYLYKDYLIRGNAFYQPKLTLSLGYEFYHFVIDVYADLGLAFEYDQYHVFSDHPCIEMILGTSTVLGAEVSYKLDTFGNIIAGFNLDYLYRKVKVTGLYESTLNGQGFLIGAHTKLRVIDGLYLTSKAGFGFEWVQRNTCGDYCQKDLSTPKKIGPVALISFGISYSFVMPVSATQVDVLSTGYGLAKEMADEYQTSQKEAETKEKAEEAKVEAEKKVEEEKTETSSSPKKIGQEKVEESSSSDKTKAGDKKSSDDQVKKGQEQKTSDKPLTQTPTEAVKKPKEVGPRQAEKPTQPVKTGQVIKQKSAQQTKGERDVER